MSISSIATNPLLMLNQHGRTRDAEVSAWTGVRANDAAKSAAAATILPSSVAVQLPMESLIALQGETTQIAAVEPPSAEDLFLEEARKSPMERMREQIMKELGVSEADLAAMPPEERRAMDDRIRELVEQKLREGMNAGKAPAETNGEMLQTLA